MSEQPGSDGEGEDVFEYVRAREHMSIRRVLQSRPKLPPVELNVRSDRPMAYSSEDLNEQRERLRQWRNALSDISEDAVENEPVVPGWKVTDWNVRPGTLGGEEFDSWIVEYRLEREEA